MRRYDLLREGAVAMAAVTTLLLALALLFGAPTRSAVTFHDWANADPLDLATTALAELAGTSDTAGYGPPYTADGSASQSLLGVAPARLSGVTNPINPREDLVLGPLSSLAAKGSELARAIDDYRSATPGQRQAWHSAYGESLSRATVDGSTLQVPPGRYGPVGTIVSSLVDEAQAGAFTADLVDSRSRRSDFYVLDTTRSSLFLGDGAYLDGLARQAGLAGDQWGAVNTLGDWPGQWWLAPFSLWYQFPPTSTSANADLLVAAVVAVLTGVVAALPWIPGLRSVPSRLGVEQLVWRSCDRGREGVS